MGSILPEILKLSSPQTVPKSFLESVPVPELSPNFGEGDKEFRGSGTGLASLIATENFHQRVESFSDLMQHQYVVKNLHIIEGNFSCL